MKSVLTYFAACFLFVSAHAQLSYPDTLFTSYFQRYDSGVNAADGTISLLLPDGRSLWMMGDSFVGLADSATGSMPCLFNVRSAIMVQDNDTLSKFTTLWNPSGADIYARQFVQMPGDNKVTYWPSAGMVEGDTAYLFWARHPFDPTKVWNLGFSGMVVAKVSLPDLQLVEVVPIYHPGIYYGMAIYKDVPRGYYYIYGKEVNLAVVEPFVARAPIGQLLGPWEFHQGNGNWSPNPDDAVKISNQAVTHEYSAFELGGRYHIFFQTNGYLSCGQGRNMYTISADVPWGPFENPRLLYTMRDTLQNSYLNTYNGQAHPQFTENDELLISYNVNGPCPDECPNPFTDRRAADGYRPKFARVPLSFIEPDFSTRIAGSTKLDVLRIFPNPATDFIQIAGIPPMGVRVDLIDMQGKHIRHTTSDQLDVKGVLTGLYMVRVEEKGRVRFGKVQILTRE